MPARFAELGDLHADIDDHVFDIAPLLEWAERDEREGAETPDEPETRPTDTPSRRCGCEQRPSRVAGVRDAVPDSLGLVEPSTTASGLEHLLPVLAELLGLLLSVVAVLGQLEVRAAVVSVSV